MLIQVLTFWVFLSPVAYASGPDNSQPLDSSGSQKINPVLPLPLDQLLPDKSKYHLFNPTPVDKMRDFTTDRPDKTESPYTVDAGHFQFETDIASYVKDISTETDATTGVTTRSETSKAYLNLINMKVGLTNTTDLQLIFESYVLNQPGPGARAGLGDITVRLKQNFLGNDGGPTALAIMPFVKIPTNTNAIGNKFVEGGLIFPIAVALPLEFGMGLMLQYNRMKNTANDQFHTELISTMTVGHSIVGDLAFYNEIFSQSSDEPSAGWVATYDMGLTYKVRPDVQFDIGINFGMTDAADDLNPFVGLSMRY